MADVTGDDDDLDSFFKEKDRKKQERLALKKAKAKAEREAMPPPSAWMTPDESEQTSHDDGNDLQTQQNDDLTGEELANRMQAQAAIHRPEDDEWIDPEREFAPISGTTKKKHRHDQNFAQDDKLLLLVAPSASKLQDLSEMSADKIAKSKAASAPSTTGTKGWSKVETKVELESIPPAGVTAGQNIVQEPEPELPSKAEPDPVLAAESGEPVAIGVFVPRHLRNQAGQGALTSSSVPGSSAVSNSPRSQSPAARPVAASDPNAYVPPSLRKAQEEARRNAAPAPSSGPSRPAGSGLAAQTQGMRPTQAAKQPKVIPNLQSADEFPSLG